VDNIKIRMRNNELRIKGNGRQKNKKKHQIGEISKTPLSGNLRVVLEI